MIGNANCQRILGSADTKIAATQLAAAAKIAMTIKTVIAILPTLPNLWKFERVLEFIRMPPTQNINYLTFIVMLAVYTDTYVLSRDFLYLSLIILCYLETEAIHISYRYALFHIATSCLSSF